MELAEVAAAEEVEEVEEKPQGVQEVFDVVEGREGTTRAPCLTYFSRDLKSKSALLCVVQAEVQLKGHDPFPGLGSFVVASR